MKLIYVTNVRLPTEKAHGLQIMKSCEAFKRAGIDIELIVPNLRASVEESPFSYYGIKNKFPLTKIFVLEILPLQRVFGAWLAPVLGYIQNISFTKSAILYLFLRGLLNKKNLFYSRDYTTLFFLSLLGLKPVAEIHDYRSKTFKWTINFILKKSKKIIVNSEGTFDLLNKHYDIDKGKIKIFPNGVDLDFFNIAESKKEARNKLNIPQNKTIIAYIGRLETVGMEKGVSHLLEAFSYLDSQNKNLLLYIIGGPDSVVKEYKSKAFNLGILNEKLIFTGHISYQRIPLYLRAVDITVIPLPKNQHAYTTSPIKLFEFLAAGKIILASDLPSLRKYLNEKNAVFFEPGNSRDLADKFKFILENKNLAERLSNQALNDSKNYSWLKRAENIIKFIYA